MDVSGVGARGIKYQRVPAEQREVGAGGAARRELRAGRAKEIQLDVERGDTGRNGDVVAEHVDEVAFPLNACPFRSGDDDAGGVDDGASRAVLAGDPLGVD